MIAIGCPPAARASEGCRPGRKPKVLDLLFQVVWDSVEVSVANLNAGSPAHLMSDAENASADAADNRRMALKKLARFVAVTPPAITLLLSVAAKPARAKVLSPIIL
jgi:hypothetical protein